jgi:hypothetical protein
MADFGTRRIAAIADEALRAAGVLGVLPTPLEALRAHARIERVRPIGLLPEGVRTPGRELLGALWFEERTLFLDERQALPRRRFTEAHELAHALLPWHEAVLREDTEAELFRPVAAAIEAEANAAAGLLIFQGKRFAARVAAAGPCGIEAALELAREHGASRHATLHHYAQSHAGAVALLTVGRFPLRGGALPVWRGVESAAFRRRHGPAADCVGGRLSPGSALHELVEAARTAGRSAAPVPVGGAVLRAEALYNRHAFLVLLAEEVAHARAA